MYHYRIKYTGVRRNKSKFSDILTVTSPYNLNESYADATFVIYQIRYELLKKTKKFEIMSIEVETPYEGRKQGVKSLEGEL